MIDHQLSLRHAALDQASRLLDANSFERVLDRGFALVSAADGRPIKRAAEAGAGADVTIRFADATRQARLDPEGPSSQPVKPAPAKPKTPSRKSPAGDRQDSLF